MPLPRLFDNVEDTIAELGEAMQYPAFRRIVDLLEAYEHQILVVGIEDADMSKDFLRGAVHAARMLRSSLSAALEQAAKQRSRPTDVRPFHLPGSGTGGIS